ncbi:hypothetical protein C8F04DRAFT_331095 [Mycena alexandri]|uniref:Uncharacterized protein n=1 Tax=Mycena alexandri TaxID=1745969 RepID=A0AAD6T360_9AGAR|nr:hypothetical protein C8F04DRAFT_331095 [Mycena alexandri]
MLASLLPTPCSAISRFYSPYLHPSTTASVCPSQQPIRATPVTQLTRCSPVQSSMFFRLGALLRSSPLPFTPVFSPYSLTVSLHRSNLLAVRQLFSTRLYIPRHPRQSPKQGTSTTIALPVQVSLPLSSRLSSPPTSRSAIHQHHATGVDHCPANPRPSFTHRLCRPVANNTRASAHCPANPRPSFMHRLCGPVTNDTRSLINHRYLRRRFSYFLCSLHSYIPYCRFFLVSCNDIIWSTSCQRRRVDSLLTWSAGDLAEYGLIVDDALWAMMRKSIEGWRADNGMTTV